jgi:uncharacterized protein (DUF4415 family)
VPSKRSEPPRGRTDWNRVRTMSDEEIERIAVADGDNPATRSDDEWAGAFVGIPPVKRSVHAAFDSDVVDFFKRGGRGYQTRMNAVLRRYMEAQLADREVGVTVPEKPDA